MQIVQKSRGGRLSGAEDLRQGRTLGKLFGGIESALVSLDKNHSG